MLALRIRPGGPILILADELGAPLATELRVPGTVSLAVEGPASVAHAEGVLAVCESILPADTRPVILAACAWSEAFRSALSIRPWAPPFEPLAKRSHVQKRDFIRRACDAARAGRAVCGIPSRIPSAAAVAR